METHNKSFICSKRGSKMDLTLHQPIKIDGIESLSQNIDHHTCIILQTNVFYVFCRLGGNNIQNKSILICHLIKLETEWLVNDGSDDRNTTSKDHDILESF